MDVEEKINPLIEAGSYSTKNTLSTNTDFLKFATEFLSIRMSALDKDIDHCLTAPYAPFPAIIYCLSTIDLLGALYAGQAASKPVMKYKTPGLKKQRIMQPKTTKNSVRYMKRFMHYRLEAIRLLQNIFRHKLVHLAQPKPVIEDKKRIIAWRYYHKNMTRHLQLTRFKKPRPVKGIIPYSLHCNYGFKISISKLKDDIVNSVSNSPNNYLNLLKTNKNLQINFRRAINEIYNPIKK